MILVHFNYFPPRLLENLLNMAITRKKRGKSIKDVYEKAEDLPEGKKKMYDSILEDFDKQGKIEYRFNFDLSGK